MPTETYTGVLDNDGSQVSIVNGPILAIHGDDPCATAAGRFAKFGETDPVTVTGTTGKVDSLKVLFVTSIDWANEPSISAAASALSNGGAVESLDAPTPAPAKRATKKAKAPATKTSPRKRR
jgi:hypothetical protein